MNVEVRRLELVISAVLLILGVLITMGASRMPMGTTSLPGPGFLPLVLGILIVLTALGVVVYTLLARETLEPVRLGHVYITVTSAALIGVGLLFERAGFLISVFLFMYVMLVVISPLGWWRSALAAAAMTGASYLCFDVLLGVRLPPAPFML